MAASRHNGRMTSTTPEATPTTSTTAPAASPAPETAPAVPAASADGSGSTTNVPNATNPGTSNRGPSSTRRGSQVVIVGGGPGGYEAALVAAQLEADVTLVERQGMGGAAVLTDVVPSKTLIATAEWRALVESADELGIHMGELRHAALEVDLGEVNARVLALAKQQSGDIRANLERQGIRIVDGTGRLASPDTVVVAGEGEDEEELHADVVLLATGAAPRELPTAIPDGERILTWTQVYSLDAMPERLVVVGSGVTGAEFAGAFSALGVDVVLISSRDRVLPGEDADAAELIENAFRRRGMEVLSRSRAAGVERRGDGVVVTLDDGREVLGSHCLLAVGGIPNTAGLGLAGSGVATTGSGHIVVDRVSRTTVRGVYAAGDVTGVLPLASVAATQGRIAMWHALGDAVAPLDVRRVPATVFTSPEIATVGVSEVDAAAHDARVTTVPLARNPRAKMLGIHEGFVKVVSREGSGSVLGGVVVAPRASELIHVLTLAVATRTTVDQLASAMTIYPSLSGSIAEGARQLHARLTD
ncbi:Dihydrolipoamide dehydrogenase [Serinibacter arcticus]|uniref:Dihydrolipoamide dehydrogenase n=2 Tax=Serinibacter arcticus TaxID=1655435 RepID=A0A4Z1E4S6_9MICO|nr:Dihydrolipoamide dehydrogenase [Serinibacter arcticus]